MFDFIEINTDGRGVATLTLARPDKHNALSAAMIAEILQAATQLGADPAVRVVVLAAQGRSFCAGADLDWMRAQLTATPESRRREALALARMLQALNTLQKPLIGCVHGNAFAGGIGLMAVCDVVVAASTARFGLTETRLGLIPATIGPYVQARIGEAGMRQVMLSARPFDTARAFALGLVTHVVGTDDLFDAVEAEVAPFFACAPGAVASAKEMTRALGPVIDETAIGATIDRLIACWEGDEAPEGIAAFFDKRDPRWVIR